MSYTYAVKFYPEFGEPFQIDGIATREEAWDLGKYRLAISENGMWFEVLEIAATW